MSQIQTKANTLHTKNVANAKGRCPFQGAGINVWEVRLITTTLIMYLVVYFIKIIKKIGSRVLLSNLLGTFSKSFFILLLCLETFTYKEQTEERIF